jgi:hypothetical protein
MAQPGARYRVGWIFVGKDEPFFVYFGLPHNTAIAAKQSIQKFCPSPYREIVMELDDPPPSD